WADELRRRADGSVAALTATSRGSHIVLRASFLPGSTGMMIPRTADGRVLFAIPWHEHLMVGTTDVAADGPAWEPQTSDAEVEFILDTARSYLQSPPARSDVLATFAGLRPLFSPRAANEAKATKKISREHAIVVEHGNLVTVIGGKWTTYRKMAADAIDQAVTMGLLFERPCTTAALKLDVDDQIEAACQTAQRAALEHREDHEVEEFVQLAARHEQACTAEDVIARRLRVGSLDRTVAERLRPLVSSALAMRSARKRAKKSHSKEWP
ncbi:MAG: FAD-dependent oxidoreductase, partial [Burkholderiaceae bacterium]